MRRLSGDPALSERIVQDYRRAGLDPKTKAMLDYAVKMAGEDYSIYTPICNALGALGKTDLLRHWRMRRVQTLEAHLRNVPEDVRARVMLAGDCASLDRVDSCAL